VCAVGDSSLRVSRESVKPRDGVPAGSLTVSKKAVQKHIALGMYVCHNAPVHMARRDTAEQVKKWFQDTFASFGPLRWDHYLCKSRCIREHCRLCESGKGHSS
jgi:hypothetical protein